MKLDRLVPQEVWLLQLCFERPAEALLTHGSKVKVFIVIETVFFCSNLRSRSVDWGQVGPVQKVKPGDDDEDEDDDVHALSI